MRALSVRKEIRGEFRSATSHTHRRSVISFPGDRHITRTYIRSLAINISIDPNPEFLNPPGSRWLAPTETRGARSIEPRFDRFHRPLFTAAGRVNYTYSNGSVRPVDELARLTLSRSIGRPRALRSCRETSIGPIGGGNWKWTLLD